MSGEITCSNCGASFSANDVIKCPKCGQHLTRVDHANITNLVPTDEEDLGVYAHNRRAYFGRMMQLSLYIMETDSRILCDFEGHLTIGRKSTESRDHLDLSAHNAIDLGVSRKHIRLMRSNATVMVEDLGTLNGTYLNGQKLSPGQTHVLCDGDELRLGKMLIAVNFERKKG